MKIVSVTTCVGAFAAMLTFGGGGIYAAGHPLMGMIVGGAGVITLGLLFAALEDAAHSRKTVVAGGATLTAAELFRATAALPIDTLVYIEGQTLIPAGRVLSCHLDGQRVMLISQANGVGK